MNTCQDGEDCEGCETCDPVTCLCGKVLTEEEIEEPWTDSRIPGYKFCSAECANLYGSKNERGEEIP